MADALERVLKGEITKLIITIPPRYGKTELAVNNFIAHGLAVNPAAKFLHLSASSSLAMENSENAKDIVKSEAYQQLFPEVQIKDSTDAKAKWYTTAGGGVYAAGAAGQITGFGAGQTDEEEDEIDEFMSAFDEKASFGGAIVIDDSLKADDADSDVKRERVNNRYSNTVKSRRNSKKTPIIIIMQRLHEHDLVGYVQEIEPGEWTVINIPALYVDENGVMQCLDPTKHTVQDLLDMEKSENEEVRLTFQRQFMQNPKPREGLLFAIDDLKFYNPAEFKPTEYTEYSFASVDPAGDGGDDLAMPFGKLVNLNNAVQKEIYIDDVIFTKDGPELTEPRIVDAILHNKCNGVNLEGNAAWFLLGSSIRRTLVSRGSDCELRIFNSSQNKHVRIVAMSAFIKRHCRFRSDWQTGSREYRRFIESLTSYRAVQTGTSKNAHDDAPDSLSMLGRHFMTQFADLYEVVVNG
jgi:predicted phage terminase large subunit-like protein